MKTRLTLVRPSGATVDLAVTTDARASIGDIAEALRTCDPESSGPAAAHGQAADPGAGWTLRIESDGRTEARVLRRSMDLAEAGLRSGSTVSLVAADPRFLVPGHDRGPAAAVLRVLTGPEAGREVQLPFGTSYVGRDHDMDVKLGDPMVSKRHARIMVGESVEVSDAGSANGVLVAGQRITRATVSPADEIVMGESTVIVIPYQLAGGLPPAGPVVEFTRSPRVVPTIAVTKLHPPQPPQPLKGMRFPWLALASPLVMAGVMLLLYREPRFVLFAALSPLLMVGSFLDQASQAKRERRAQVEQFDAGLAALRERIDVLHAEERRVRSIQVPSVADVADAVLRHGPLLWTHRSEHDQFLAVRLGKGTITPAVQVDELDQNNTLPEFWTQVEEVRETCAHLTDAPVIENLRTCGALGVVGAIESAGPVARGIVVQLAGLHSPADLTIAALVSQRSRAQWEWLTWLPHVGGPHSPLPGEHLADNPAAAASLVARLEQLVSAREDEQPAAGLLDPTGSDGLGPVPALPAVVAIVQHDAPASQARLMRLAEQGPAVGVYVIWVAPSLAQLPASCRTFIQLEPSGAMAGQVRRGETTVPLECEGVDAATAAMLGRVMAPVVDAGAPLLDESDVPSSVSYLDLAGTSLASDANEQVARWRQTHSLRSVIAAAGPRRYPDAGLRALIGHAGDESLVVDLRADGPHALVGGTTGAGKSELLQSWVLGIANAYSPDRATFLFVDYKGGAAFGECLHLPHTVGLVTDLSPHLVRRALTSLRAELRFREHLLNRKKAKDLVSLERAGDPDAPPSLIIVVDEFAALATDVPEFVDGVIDVAQRGRSLGLHLVLATQRPAGVITGSLRANTNLRIALRMSDADDSVDILGTPLAAHFEPGTPGRAAVKSGPGRVRTFQAAYAGGWTSEVPDRPRIDIEEIAFGPGRAWEMPSDDVPRQLDLGPTDIARIVETVGAAATLAQVRQARKPWLPELAQTYALHKLPNPRSDARILLGVLDQPQDQDQPILTYEPDVDGNLVVYGTGGSGKTTVLRTMAVSAAVTTRGGPVEIYAIDSAGSGLQVLAPMPHVGAVIDGEDEERVVRLLRRMRDLVDERGRRYSQVKAGSIVEYRAIAGMPDEPRVLIMIDSIGAFRERYEYAAGAVFPVYGALTQLAADGRAVGVHLVVTADHPTAMPSSLGSTFQKRIVLRLTSEDDYTILGEPKDVIVATSPPGRGVMGGNEVQVAVIAGDSNVAVQARETEALAAAMRSRGRPDAAPVERLGDHIDLSTLPASVDGRPVIGLEDSELAPVGIELSGTLMVSGPPGSGRSTAVATIAAAVRRARPATRLVLVSARRSPLAAWNQWDKTATGADEVASVADELEAALVAGRFAPGSLVVVAEGITELAGTSAEQSVVRLLAAVARAECLAVGEAEVSTWSQAWALSQPFKSGRRGILLQPGDNDGDTLLSTSLGRFRRADLPQGRGFLVAGGRAARVQLGVFGGALS